MVELSVPCHGPSGEWLCLPSWVAFPVSGILFVGTKACSPYPVCRSVQISSLHCVGLLSGSCQVDLLAHQETAPAVEGQSDGLHFRSGVWGQYSGVIIMMARHGVSNTSTPEYMYTAGSKILENALSCPLFGSSLRSTYGCAMY